MMGELRKDYLLDRFVILSPGRGKRPHELQPVKEQVAEGTCFFCPGNEKLTPSELGRVDDGKGSWRIRWFENKFAAVVPEGMKLPRTDNVFYTWANSVGHHEIIVNTPVHGRHTGNFSVDELQLLLDVYRRRIAELSQHDDVGYVSIFKNHGYLGATSIAHSHSQIITTAIVPPDVQAKVAARNRFIECPYCKVVDSERSSPRRRFENEAYVAFAPYASRFNYEVWIMPKRHETGFSRLDCLADILKQVLQRIASMGWAYNLMITYSPRGADLHFHIEIAPRVAIWGGFELGTGIIINSVPPEEAANFYRGDAA